MEQTPPETSGLQSTHDHSKGYGKTTASSATSSAQSTNDDNDRDVRSQSPIPEISPTNAAAEEDDGFLRTHIEFLTKIRNAQNSSVTPSFRVEDLAKRVQNLPPELYNLIYKFTFSFASGNRLIYRDLVSQYKPPTVLQVDRASRALAAPSYYNNTLFCFTIKVGRAAGGWPPAYDIPGEFWLRSLTAEHRKGLRDLYVAGRNNLGTTKYLLFCLLDAMGLKKEDYRERMFRYGEDVTVWLERGE